MSSEETGESSQITHSHSRIPTEQSGSQSSIPTAGTTKRVPESQTQTTVQTRDDSEQDTKPAANPDQPSDITSPSTPDDPRLRPRQVIAVSASKGPAAFFNLARKFLVTDEMCDLSALEGAIVSAADAAHLLERSKLATIVRVQTSYVTVEPKRKRQVPSPQPGQTESPIPAASDAKAQTPSVQAEPGTHAAAAQSPAAESHAAESHTEEPSATHRSRQSSGRELRRARIIITVKRTESYKRWLEENPLQAVIAGDVDDIDDEEHGIHGDAPS